MARIDATSPVIAIVVVRFIPFTAWNVLSFAVTIDSVGTIASLSRRLPSLSITEKDPLRFFDGSKPPAIFM